MARRAKKRDRAIPLLKTASPEEPCSWRAGCWSKDERKAGFPGATNGDTQQMPVKIQKLAANAQVIQETQCSKRVALLDRLKWARREAKSQIIHSWLEVRWSFCQRAGPPLLHSGSKFLGPREGTIHLRARELKFYIRKCHTFINYNKNSKRPCTHMHACIPNYQLTTYILQVINTNTCYT